VQANRTLARLKTLFKWVLDEEFILADPTARVRKVVKETARDRTLTDDEIRLFWVACDKLGWPFGPMYKLLLLTGQQRDEVGGVEWSEIDLKRRLWTVPRNKAKNDRAHEVHLSSLAVEILDELPKIGSRYALTTNGWRPISGFSKSKQRLDQHMLDLLRTELAGTGKTLIRGRSMIGSCMIYGGQPQPEWLGSTSRRTSSTRSLIT